MTAPPEESNPLKSAFEKLSKYLEEHDLRDQALAERVKHLNFPVHKNENLKAQPALYIPPADTQDTYNWTNNTQSRHDEYQDEFWETVWLARATFMRALQSTAPECLTNLKTLAELYPTALATIGNRRWEKLQLANTNSAQLPVQQLSQDSIPQLVNKLHSWAIKYSLANTDDNWVLNEALDLLKTWTYAGLDWKLGQTYRPAPPIAVGIGWRPPRFALEAIWDPKKDAKTNAEQRIRAEFEEKFKRYISQTELEAKLRGIRIYEPRGLRDGSSTGVLPDAVRLVRYQVLGKSHENIALDSTESFGNKGLTTEGVRRGVNRFAELIGVTLRERGLGGRPRKQQKPQT